MRLVLADHDEVVRSAVEGHGGIVFKHTGDGMCAAFSSATDALRAAVDAQRRLLLRWPSSWRRRACCR
jgi:class 3 adenylate cyclase